MELNPIKRFKLSREMNKNFRTMKNLDKNIKEIQKMFDETNDVLIKMYLVHEEREHVTKHTNLLKRNDEIFKQLYGGLV